MGFDWSEALWGHQSSHIILKLLASDLILEVCHSQEVLPCVLLCDSEGESHAFEAEFVDDSLFAVGVAAEDAVCEFFQVLLVAVLGHFLQKLDKFLLAHGLLLAVVLLHEADQEFLVLELGLAFGVDWVIKRADHFGQEIDGNGVIEVIVEGQGAEDLLRRESLLIHLLIICRADSIIQNMGNCTGLKKSPLHAATTPSPLPALQPDQLVCGICAVDFNCNDRSPMMLCLNQHNACRVCVQQLCSAVPARCPFCREEVNPKCVASNRILMEIVGRDEEEKEEGEQDRVQRVLGEARRHNLQRVIYLIEVGTDLAKIKEMHLWNLSLSAIIDLSIFPALSTLDLHKNCLTQIRNVGALTELAYLNLGYNQISAIANLSTLSKLQFLDLCHNFIAKIENISTLKSLHTLNLSHNSIQVVENLYQLPKLTILYLQNNPICVENSCGSIQALQHRGVIIEVTPNTGSTLSL